MLAVASAARDHWLALNQSSMAEHTHRGHPLNAFTTIFLAALVIQVAVHAWLMLRHQRHVQAHRDAVPAAFAARVPLDTHRKAADYTLAKLRLGWIGIAWNALLLLGWTLGGGIQALDQWWRALEWSPLVTGTAFLFSAFAIMAILELPFALYRQFVIEQHFGFNRMSLRLFVTDLAKLAALLVAIGTPLAVLVLWLMEGAGSTWWLWVWAVWMAFSVLMSWAYPSFIAPIFNTFKPLEDETLRARIENLLARTGFPSRGIFVMDGSTRSTHGNAYFSGFGAGKRIVFFDTLLDELDADEIESVLAHELGHFKRRHVLKNIAIMAVLSLALLATLGWLIDAPWFYAGLGVSQPSVHVALLLFVLALDVFFFWLLPLIEGLSRRFEFEADAYAAQHADADALIRGLVKLDKSSANTLTPDPLYSAFHDSHPPTPLRVARLTAMQR